MSFPINIAILPFYSLNSVFLGWDKISSFVIFLLTFLINILLIIGGCTWNHCRQCWRYFLKQPLLKNESNTKDVQREHNKVKHEEKLEQIILELHLFFLEQFESSFENQQVGKAFFLITYPNASLKDWVFANGISFFKLKFA